MRSRIPNPVALTKVTELSTFILNIGGCFFMNGIQDDIKNAFLKATTREMAAEVLGTTQKRVNYYLFKLPSDKRYSIRMIVKKS